MSNYATPTPVSSRTSVAIHAVLVPGYWLGAWAWNDVEPRLRVEGITTHAVTLPGLDGSGTDDVTLEDHIDAVNALVGGLKGGVVLVGHSGGGAVVQGVIDRQPARIDRVIYVDSGPLLDGVSLMPNASSDVPLPTWDELTAQNSSIEGMDEAALATFRERAVDQPNGVVRARIRVTNTQRFHVPATVICTSLPSHVLRAMVAAGEMPSELDSVRDVRYIDLPTGHWPMFSRPTDLADILTEEVLRSPTG